MSEDLGLKFESFNNLADRIVEQIEAKKEEIETKRKEVIELELFGQFDKDKLKKFFDEPFAIIPSKRRDEWRVVVPNFIPIQLGWLEASTKSFNIFIVNKFMNWLAEIPKSIQKRFKFDKPLPLSIFDGTLLTGKEHQEEAWSRYKGFLNKREGSDRIKIKRGSEFKILAKLIDDGILPFIPKPIEESDLRYKSINYELRDYQDVAWRKFLETGAVGVYWPMSAGKTILGLKALAMLKGPKAVIVPTKTLKDQWNDHLRENNITDVEVETYLSAHKFSNREMMLTVFDECHRLPANKFSKLATIKTKYRMGLSATPYREDGRTDYIFALTGFPIGLDWNSLIDLGIIKKPNIRLYLVADMSAKVKKLAELLENQKKTLIFCDGIDFGNKLSKKFEIPFVYGATSNRLEIIKNSETCIVSRVGDEGISIKDLERVIEIDFLFGSRRQEAQRLGRIFHSDEEGEHIIIMTNYEYESYEKRLFSIIEKGFKIEVVNA